MNLKDARHKDFALVREMLETPDVIRRFDPGQMGDLEQAAEETGKLFLTGEGSSRIFPAKNMIVEMMKRGGNIAVGTDGSRQAHEYELQDYAVVGASNSGQTKEVISLFTRLSARGHRRLFGLTANHGTKLESVSNRCYVLGCGKENAVAATKSVVEQALFYQALARALPGRNPVETIADASEAGDAAKAVLEMELDGGMVEAVASAGTVYFAGRNDGVAEELTLKTNEIMRQKSDFLEGTYAVHGIEEVMDSHDVVIVIAPFPEEQEKFKEALVNGVGLKVFAISSEETLFPTIRIPNVPGYETFMRLLAGWNILVSVGVSKGINLDKPVRARKVGNEFIG